MNKNLKKAIWYSTILLILGGISAGIAVPIVLNSQKIYYDPPLNVKGSDSITGDLTVDEIKNALDQAGINDNTLLDKTNEATAFYLYKKEQEGSIALQRLNFLWDQYTKLLDIRNYIDNTLNRYDIEEEKEFISKYLVDGTTAKTDQYQTVFENTLIPFINEEINKAKSEGDTKKAENYQLQLDSYNKEWENIKKKIENIDNKTIDYGENSFASKYPTILLPEDKIREKQQRDYNDQKQGHISTFATKEEGQASWETKRIEDYGGATSDSAAVDYLVFNQIKTSAFKKYSYKVDSSYNVGKVKSMIFKEIVGDQVTADTAEKIAIDSEHQGKEDKVFFIASETRIIENINISGNSDYDTIETIVNNRNLLEIQNVVIDMKQSEDSSITNWTISKDILQKWFLTTNQSTKLVVDDIDKIFTAASGDGVQTEAEIARDKNLIGRYTSTTDSTQWKNGNLGFMTALDAVGMVPAYGVGMTAILDDLYGNNILANAATPPITEAFTFLSDLTSEVKTSLVALMKDEGYSVLAGQIENNSFDTNFNKEITKFFNSAKIDDAKIQIYIGEAVANKFNTITNVSGKDQSGIAQVLKISSNSNIYMIVTPEYGIHIIKVNTGISSISAAIKSDLAKMAKEQDPAKATTDFGKLFNDNYDRQNQIKDLLTNEDYKAFLNENIDEYEKVGDTIASDVESMIDSLIANSVQKRINDIDPQQYIDYLIGAFDNDLVSEDFAADPAKLYNAIEKLATATTGGSE